MAIDGESETEEKVLRRYSSEQRKSRTRRADGAWLYNRDNKNRECPGYTTVKTEQTKLDEWTVASLYSSAI